MSYNINYLLDHLFAQSPTKHPIATICAFLVVALHLVYHATMPACRFTLRILRTLTRTINQGSPVEGIPADLSTSLKMFNIMPDTVTYACCPECFALYPPETSLSNGPISTQTSHQPDVRVPDPLPYPCDPCMGMDPPTGNHDAPRSVYPMYCRFKETSESAACGAKLLRLSKKRDPGGHRQPFSTDEHPFGPAIAQPSAFRPIRTYKYQPVIAWLARMFAREDFERLVDQPLKSSSCHGTPKAHVDDILQSPEVETFLDNDGKPFLQKMGTEARLVFSLFIDWFNPRGNRRAGASISSGVLFMACLNLPPEVRYKRENIYLAGILPGPKAPSLQEVNHYVAPLIPELLELWNDGVWYSRTALFPEGRIARGALIPVVSDLGAVRKTTGQASHSATYFCSFCQLKKCDISVIDPAKWPRRDCEAFRRSARSWLAAPNTKERERLFKITGIRYSVLLELPYWKPTQFVVLDTMHNLFLGLFQRHCRKVFGMNIAVDDGASPLEESDVSAEDLVQAIKELQRRETPQSLKTHLTLPVMRALYEAAALGNPGKRTKLQMAEELLAQVGPEDSS